MSQSLERLAAKLAMKVDGPQLRDALREGVAHTSALKQVLRKELDNHSSCESASALALARCSDLKGNIAGAVQLH